MSNIVDIKYTLHLCLLACAFLLLWHRHKLSAEVEGVLRAAPYRYWRDR